MVGSMNQFVVEKDESVLEIARQFSLAVEHIAFANGFPDTITTVVGGTSLTIPGMRVLPADPPKDGLVLNIPERGMYLFKGGQFQRFIPVSVGTPPGALTPLGQFQIIERIKNPTWFPPSWAGDTTPVPAGPANPLGTRWIGISAPRVGIHGTNDPLNVGASVTHGCIRCYPDHVEKLFEEVKVGMPVRIEYETAKLGKDAEGKTFIVTFPDPYKKSDPLERARKLLAKTGHESKLQDKKFAAKLKLQLGVPVQIGP